MAVILLIGPFPTRFQGWEVAGAIITLVQLEIHRMCITPPGAAACSPSPPPAAVGSSAHQTPTPTIRPRPSDHDPDPEPSVGVASPGAPPARSSHESRVNRARQHRPPHGLLVQSNRFQIASLCRMTTDSAGKQLLQLHFQSRQCGTTHGAATLHSCCRHNPNRPLPECERLQAAKWNGGSLVLHSF